MSIVIRDAVESDFQRIIEINKTFEHFTSQMGMDKITHLDRESCYHRVAEVDGKVAAFLIAMAPGADYKSPNYLWFSEQYKRFVYIDRIVIDVDYHRQGLGARLYQDLFDFAKAADMESVTCEFYTKPENAVSAAFHQRFGIEQVGTLTLDEGDKQVSLQKAAF